jgi:3' exoribonuclease, RNase T-like
MIHVMADIETLGTGDNACPVVIAAVKFDGTTIHDKFEVGVDPGNAQRYGRVITGETIMYWLDPKRDEARKRLVEIPKVDLPSALHGFADWCRLPVDAEPHVSNDEFGTTYKLGSLWGKGSTFDNIILRNAASAVGADWPFSFRQDECYRTMANRFPGIDYVQHGVAHVAVDDALSQALHLQEICRVHGIRL